MKKNNLALQLLLGTGITILAIGIMAFYATRMNAIYPKHTWHTPLSYVCLMTLLIMTGFMWGNSLKLDKSAKAFWWISVASIVATIFMGVVMKQGHHLPKGEPWSLVEMSLIMCTAAQYLGWCIGVWPEPEQKLDP